MTHKVDLYSTLTRFNITNHINSYFRLVELMDVSWIELLLWILIIDLVHAILTTLKQKRFYFVLEQVIKDAIRKYNPFLTFLKIKIQIRWTTCSNCSINKLLSFLYFPFGFLPRPAADNWKLEFKWL